MCHFCDSVLRIGPKFCSLILVTVIVYTLLLQVLLISYYCHCHYDVTQIETEAVCIFFSSSAYNDVRYLERCVIN